jgi:hypothetical protein
MREDESSLYQKSVLAQLQMRTMLGYANQKLWKWRLASRIEDEFRNYVFPLLRFLHALTSFNTPITRGTPTGPSSGI